MKRKKRGRTISNKNTQNIRKKINWTSIFTFAAQLGSLCTAVVALFALREAIVQRESMYKPELYIDESYFCAKEDSQGKMRYFLFDKDSFKVKEEVVFPFYNLINVGFGAALSANVFWHLDSTVIEKNLKQIELSDANIVSKDTFGDVLFGKDRLRYINDGVTAGWMVNYVMPYNSESSGNRGYYDPKVSEAISKILLWHHKSSQTSSANPRLTIPATLKYKDINGKWYTKNYEMTIDVIQYIDDSSVVYRVCPGMRDFDLYKELEEMGRVDSW